MKVGFIARLLLDCIHIQAGEPGNKLATECINLTAKSIVNSKYEIPIERDSILYQNLFFLILK